MQGFQGAIFSNILDFLDDCHSCPNFEGWRARQQKTIIIIQPEPTATTYTSFDGEEDGYDDNCIHSALQRRVESRLQKELLKAVKDYKNYNGYDPFNTSKWHKSRKRIATPITYDDDDLFVALPRNQQYADHHHATCRQRRPPKPKFISCPNGTVFPILSHNNSQKIPDTSRTDLENVLLLQGQCFLEAFGRCLKYLHTPHENKISCRDQRHLNL